MLTTKIFSRSGAAVLLALFVCAPLAQAEDLLDVYKYARANDARFNAARNEYMALRQALPQARGTYLPNIALSADTIETDQEIISSDNEVFGSGKSTFDTDVYAVTLTQPVFRLSNIVQIKQAGAAVREAYANFVAAEQDLMLRTASAYLGALAAQDNVGLTEAQKKAIERQLKLAEKRLQVGLATITDKHEAKARFEFSRARVIEAESTLDDSYEALAEITGVDRVPLVPLSPDIVLTPPQPASADAWISKALAQNVSLQARKHAMEVARREIQRQRAEYYPTVDLVGSHNRRDTGGSLFGGGSEVETTDVILRLALPIFQGGQTLYRTREASYRFRQAADELEAQRRLVRRQTREAFLGTNTGISKASAFEQSVLSQETALNAKIKGFEAGVGTNLAVLDAQRDLYLAKRDHLQARYDYLLSSLRLKQSAGILSPADLAQVNQMLAGQPVAPGAPGGVDEMPGMPAPVPGVPGGDGLLGPGAAAADPALAPRPGPDADSDVGRLTVVSVGAPSPDTFATEPLMAPDAATSAAPVAPLIGPDVETGESQAEAGPSVAPDKASTMETAATPEFPVQAMGDTQTPRMGPEVISTASPTNAEVTAEASASATSKAELNDEIPAPAVEEQATPLMGPEMIPNDAEFPSQAAAVEITPANPAGYRTRGLVGPDSLAWARISSATAPSPLVDREYRFGPTSAEPEAVESPTPESGSGEVLLGPDLVRVN